MAAADNPDASDDDSAHYYLFARDLQALDLPATGAGLAALDFDVQLQADTPARILHAHWQPDAMLHPDHPAERSFARPPQVAVELAFQPVDATLLAQIVQALDGEAEDVPALLRAAPLVVHVVTPLRPRPGSRIAMLWTLLGELAAHAPDPAQVVLYDAAWNQCIPHDQAREHMAWRDQLDYLDALDGLNLENARPSPGQAAREEVDIRADLAGQTAREQASRRGTAPASPEAAPAPGEQPGGIPGLRSVVVALLVLVGWYLWSTRGG